VTKVQIYTFGFRGFPGVQGGIETHAEHLAPELVQLGYHVTACLRSPYTGEKPTREWNGVDLLRLWTVRNAYCETLLHSLVCALVAGFLRPQIVHVHGIGPALVTPLLRIMGLRVIVTHHGEDYNREKWGLLARAILHLGEIAGMRFANQRIAVSQNIEKLILKKYGKSCEFIPNGVVCSDRPTQTDRVTDLGLIPGRYVLTVGRLVPEKRHSDLLHAFRDAKLDGWKLTIVGRLDGQGKYADDLASEARATKNVVMTDFQTGETLRQLYAHAGLFVLPSSHEGLPIALLEALSYGLPVLVSDIPSNLEIVSDPAHIFKVGDTHELGSKLLSLAVTQADLASREAVGRDTARRYDWSDIALKTAAAYRGLIGAEGDRSPLRGIATDRALPVGRMRPDKMSTVAPSAPRKQIRT
jgi:glycosyltransferase involved in cell wall biosynthesis